MAIRLTQGRHDLKIKANNTVLEVIDSGDPFYRSDIITSISNHKKIKIFPHQTFVASNGMHLQLCSNSFDYVICRGVLEQAEYPDRIVAEITRVAQKGYIETINMLAEMVSPQKEHKWAILIIDGKLVFYEKNLMPLYIMEKYKEMFLAHNIRQRSSKIISTKLPNHFTSTNIEWEGEIECLINPDDDRYKAYFIHEWDSKMVDMLYPTPTVIVRLWQYFSAQYHRAISKLLDTIRPQAISLEEYRVKQGGHDPK